VKQIYVCFTSTCTSECTNKKQTSILNAVTWPISQPPINFDVWQCGTHHQCVVDKLCFLRENLWFRLQTNPGSVESNNCLGVPIDLPRISVFVDISGPLRSVNLTFVWRFVVSMFRPVVFIRSTNIVQRIEAHRESRERPFIWENGVMR